MGYESFKPSIRQVIEGLYLHFLDLIQKEDMTYQIIESVKEGIRDVFDFFYECLGDLELDTPLTLQ